MREFKIGDAVKDVRFGYGEVQVIDSICNYDYIVVVVFDGLKNSYTNEGKGSTSDPYRSLFHAEEEIIVPKPKKKVRIQGWLTESASAFIVFKEMPSFTSVARIDTEVEVEE